MKKHYWARSAVLILVGVVCLPGLASMASGGPPDTQTITAGDDKPLAKPGQKVPLGADHYFVYGFDKPPKLGTSVMKLEIFTNNGSRDTTYVVKGDADMPSMRGAHSTGDKQFYISGKGVYLLPVQLVMPGVWEFRFTFDKNGKKVLNGRYQFEL